MKKTQIIKCPSTETSIHKISVFLAGSIEMDQAEEWQRSVENFISSYDIPVTIYNPRREKWDSTGKQSLEDANFVEQVNWELDKIDSSDYVLVHFVPNTKSPISLLELGHLGDKNKAIVSCSSDFWRSGNVHIFCKRNEIPYFESLDSAVNHLLIQIRNEILHSIHN
jgi:hypothetical protein